MLFLDVIFRNSEIFEILQNHIFLAIQTIILLRTAYSDSFRIEDNKEKHIIHLDEEHLLRDISHMYNKHYDCIVPLSLLNDNEWNIKNYLAGVISIITKQENKLNA